jgi:hypothetical protein
MTDKRPQTDRDGPPTPAPWPLTGEAPPTDQPEPSEVLPMGNASEPEMLKSDEDES